jgi:hypothetical protein
LWVWRIAWHTGFKGTHTAETANPIKFIHELHASSEHVDWVEVYGAYFAPQSKDQKVMALPVVSSVTFDKTSYSAGQVITATVHYSDPNTSGGTATTTYTVAGTVTDSATGEVGTLSGTYAVNGTAGVPNPAVASLSGGEANQVWTKVSDDGKSVAVFTATA